MKVLFILLLTCSMMAQGAPRTEVMTLNYRTAEDLQPTVQSLLGDQGRVNVYGNQLIVNAEPAQLAEIRNILAQLDTKPRRLLITLSTRSGSRGSVAGAGIGGDLRAPDAHVIEYDTGNQDDREQRVQATEGYPALIRFGQDLPVTTYQSSPYGQSYAQTDYRHVERGFRVTARLAGNLVHLEMDSVDDRPDHYRPGVVATGGANTRLTGPVGQWLDVGGVEQQSSYSNNGLVRHYSTEGREDRQLSIRVDVLD